LYAWGNGEFGRCGNGKSDQPVPELVEVLQDMRFVQASAGHSFSTAVTDTGDLYAWGKNDQAQLGIGTNVVMDMNTMEEFPVKVEFGGG
jgi:alpha-tubulin suppressor-like RCC1 family protein